MHRHRSADPQADLLEIESRAKRLLADEYDAAQERGEVRKQSDNQPYSKAEKAGPADLGLSPKAIHESRLIRDAEKASPGIVRGDSAPEWSSKGVPNSIMLEKPFAMAQLVTAISQLLNGRSSGTSGS